MCDALILANSLGFNRVEAESDSQIFVEFSSEQSRWWDAASTIFAECIDVSSMIGQL